MVVIPGDSSGILFAILSCKQNNSSKKANRLKGRDAKPLA